MNHLPLLYISAIAGFIVVIGSLVLIAMGRVLVDVSGQSVDEVSLPFGFRVKTQRPFVIMFLFGAFLLAMPLLLVRNKLNATPDLLVTGRIDRKAFPSDYKIRAYATVDSNDNVFNEIRLSIPLLENPRYKVVYYDDKGYLYDEYVDWKKVVDGQYTLPGFDPPPKPPSRLTAESAAPTGNANPDVTSIRESDALVRKFRPDEVTR
jgi:hypothetical protein